MAAEVAIILGQFSALLEMIPFWAVLGVSSTILFSIVGLSLWRHD